MKKFYGTFMQKQAFKNMYVEINAEYMEDARAAMFDHFGEKFMTVYSAEGFEGQVEDFGLARLMEITAINHESLMEYLLDGLGNN